MLTDRLEFLPERDREVFAAVPAAPAVFSLRGVEAHAEPYVGKTANLRRRLLRLLGPVEERTKRLSLRGRVRSIEFTRTGSDFESGFVLYRALREVFPKTYGDRMRFRFAPLVKLHLENEFPRASVTTRLGRLDGPQRYYGPFLSRAAAEKFMNDSLDFFKMRRCVDDLHPDPAFPGCMYSDMKMCLAPCFRGCTDAEYSSEVQRVQAYFDSAGDSLVREISAQRDAAAEKLAFEDAAAIHVRVEKLKAATAQLRHCVRRIDRWHAVMVQPSSVSSHVALFKVAGGVISGPVAFSPEPAEHTKSQSLEARLREALESFPAAGKPSALETMEHLALLKRWLYRSSKTGEIFLADERGDLPMRRIVRGIGRVLRGERGEEVSGLNLSS
jgi:excinuclease ABC subunit C